MDKFPTVIVDVDGTLVDVTGVRHYVMDDPRKKDFKHFHAGAALCPPIQSTLDILNAIDPDTMILVVTSRKSEWRYQTIHWLRKWEVPYDALYMRDQDDNRKDADVKRDIHTVIVANGYSPILAIDDNPSIVALWKELGIPTVVVPGWVES